MTDLKTQIMQITNAHYPGAYKETNVSDPNRGLSKVNPLRLPLYQHMQTYDRFIIDADHKPVAEIASGGGDCHTNDVAGQIIRAVNAHEELLAQVEHAYINALRLGDDKWAASLRSTIKMARG